MKQLTSLNKHVFQLLLLHCAATTFFIYIDIFVNLYIWKENKDFTQLVLFNLVSFIFMWIPFWLGMWILSKTNFRFLMKLFTFFSLLFFIILSFVPIESLTVKTIIIGIIYALMKGLYYSGSNFTLSALGKNEEFVHYFSYIAISKFLLSIVVPIFSSLFIYLFNFYGSFIFMFFLSAVLLFFNSKLPVFENKQNTPFFKDASFSKTVDSKAKKLMMTSSFFYSFVTQFLIIFTMIFTFTITDHSFYIALLNILYSFLTFFALKFYRALKLNEFHWLYIGIFLIFAGCLIVFYTQTSLYLLLANLLFTTGYFYFDNIAKTQQFYIIKESTDVQKMHLLSWRETILSFSRVLLLSSILVLSSFQSSFRDGSFYFLTLISILFSFLMVFVNKSFIKEMQKKDAD